MATNFLTLINGIPRLQPAPGTTVIYDQSLTLVAASPGTNQIIGPITAGTSISLPVTQTYTGSELQIYLNGDRQETVFDYTYVGSGSKTQVQFTYGLVVGDRIDFRIDRLP